MLAADQLLLLLGASLAATHPISAQEARRLSSRRDQLVDFQCAGVQSLEWAKYPQLFQPGRVQSHHRHRWRLRGGLTSMAIFPLRRRSERRLAELCSSTTPAEEVHQLASFHRIPAGRVRNSGMAAITACGVEFGVGRERETSCEPWYLPLICLPAGMRRARCWRPRGWGHPEALVPPPSNRYLKDIDLGCGHSPRWSAVSSTAKKCRSVVRACRMRRHSSRA